MKQFSLFCDHCGHRSVVDENPQKFGGEKGYYQYQTAECPARIPYRDQETRKVVNPKDISLMPKFRCPDCGRALSARKVYTKKEEPSGKDQADRRENGTAGSEIPKDAS